MDLVVSGIWLHIITPAQILARLEGAEYSVGYGRTWWQLRLNKKSRGKPKIILCSAGSRRKTFFDRSCRGWVRARQSFFPKFAVDNPKEC